MNELEKAWRIGTPEKLRGSGMGTQVQGKGIDFRLKESIRMVDGRIRGLAENQRRVRYFGFETTHEQDKK